MPTLPGGPLDVYAVHMGTLSYTGLISLDGYYTDAAGGFDWAMPDDEVHAAVNDLERGVSTMVLGRRLYETLVVWETLDLTDEPDVIVDYARLWRDTDKVVYSSTLEDARSARTRILPSFDADELRTIVEQSPGVTSIGGPTLAAHALRAGLVDEIHQFVSPVIVGGGTRFLPEDARLDLHLADTRAFGNGVVYSKYVRT